MIEVNGELDDEPQKINDNAYEAWMFRLRPDNTSELDALLDASGYGQFVESEAH